MFITSDVQNHVLELIRFLEEEAGRVRMASTRLAASQQEERLFAIRASERMLSICIECIADIGNAVIDALVMRDPASYADIVEVLLDEQVISTTAANGVIQIVLMRKLLMQEYSLDHEQEVLAAIDLAPSMFIFAADVTNYLRSLGQ